jgi:hypothetical protein
VPLSGKDKGARTLGSALSVTSEVPRLFSWTQPTRPRQRAGRCRGCAPRSSWSARNLPQSHRKGRCRNRASPLRSQTCSSNLVPACERIPRATSRKSLRCARSAEGERKGTMQERRLAAPLHRRTSRSGYNDIVHMDVERAANQQDTNSRGRTRPTAQAENTLGFRSMQVIFWLRRLKG